MQVALEVDEVIGFSQVLYLVLPGAFLILLDVLCPEVLGSIDPSDGSPCASERTSLNSCGALLMLDLWVCVLHPLHLSAQVFT